MGAYELVRGGDCNSVNLEDGADAASSAVWLLQHLAGRLLGRMCANIGARW